MIGALPHYAGRTVGRDIEPITQGEPPCWNLQSDALGCNVLSGLPSRTDGKQADNGGVIKVDRGIRRGGLRGFVQGEQKPICRHGLNHGAQGLGNRLGNISNLH